MTSGIRSGQNLADRQAVAGALANPVATPLNYCNIPVLVHLKKALIAYRSVSPDEKVNRSKKGPLNELPVRLLAKVRIIVFRVFNSAEHLALPIVCERWLELAQWSVDGQLVSSRWNQLVPNGETLRTDDSPFPCESIGSRQALLSRNCLTVLVYEDSCPYRYICQLKTLLAGIFPISGSGQSRSIGDLAVTRGK